LGERQRILPLIFVFFYLFFFLFFQSKADPPLAELLSPTTFTRIPSRHLQEKAVRDELFFLKNN